MAFSKEDIEERKKNTELFMRKHPAQPSKHMFVRGLK